jgi:ABC-type branched-subunit amino acid transport system substrate-binding protein
MHAVVALAVATALVVIGSACSSTTTSGATQPAGTTDDASALLGPKHEATGSPIKIGFVDDGKAQNIDFTATVAAFDATVQYANEHLGGINGHQIVVDECATNDVPSQATDCGVRMVNDKVAAVLVPVSAQDSRIFDALDGSGVPYVTYAASAQNIVTKPGAFLLTNPLATLAAPAKIAKDDNVKKAAIVVVDVPAATGPLTSIAQPIFKKAGIDLDVIPIPLETADMTPQLQQAISGGAEQFTVIGQDAFNGTAIKTLKQLGFTGKVLMVTAPTQNVVDAVPGGLGGVVYVTSATTDPSDRDVQLYDAVTQTYMNAVVPDTQSAWAFSLVLAFVKALEGDTAAVDAPTVTKALSSMPKALPVPLGGGLEYQCGAKVISFLPNVCADNALSTTLDDQGHGEGYTKLDVSAFTNIGG